MGNRPEQIHLYRSPMARLTGKKEAGMFLLEMCKQEKPIISQVSLDEENQVEHWFIEKQFWLKFRQQFKDFGYLPQQKINEIKKIPHMLEKF